jgi:hypothetical protein
LKDKDSLLLDFKEFLREKRMQIVKRKLVEMKEITIVQNEEYPIC